MASWIPPSNSAGVGRVNLAATPTAEVQQTLPGFSHRVDAKNYEQDMIRGNMQSTPVSKAFFSAENMEVLQNALRKSVYDRSGSKRYLIDRQSADELQIIMRSMFLQFAKNNFYDIPGQVAELNQRVVDWATPKLLAAVEGYYGYLRDISEGIKPMDRPVSLSSAGTKSLPFNNFV
jgi:hypothetical protein